MMTKAVAVIVLLSAAAAGCTSTTARSLETGLFDDDPDEMIAAYGGLEKKIDDGEKVTIKDLEQMGFDLNAPNVEPFPGPAAFKKLFGDLVFGNPADPKGLSQYRGYLIPYQLISTTSDRIYISTQETTRRGLQIRVFVILKDDAVCYHELQRLKFETYECRTALLEGLIDLFKGPGKAAFAVLATLQNYKNPGIESPLIIPIVAP